MTVELLAALIVIALGCVQVVLQAAEYRRVHGVAYANSALDQPSAVPDSLLLGRLTRALRNLHETLPFFLGLVVILALMDVSTPVSRVAAMVFAGARVVYLPLYAMGIPYLRGMVWMVAFVAMIVLLVVALGAADWSVLTGAA